MTPDKRLEDAEKAAMAVLDAGRYWKGFKTAVSALQDSQLTPNTVVALLSDELDMPKDDISRVLNAFDQLPEKYCTVAA